MRNSLQTKLSKKLTVIIERHGECNRCGYCCSGCVHLTPKWEGAKPFFYKCDIYDKREEFCSICGRTHAGCISDYPKYPIRGACPECGYRFYDKQSGAEVLEIKLKDWNFIEKHGN